MPGPFSPFFGDLYQTGEAIRAGRDQSVTAALQQKYLGQRMANDAAAEGRAQTQFGQEQQLMNTKLLNMAAAEVAQNPNAAQRWDSVLRSAIPNWEPIQGGDPAQIQAAARQIYESTSAALNAFNGSNGQANVQSTQVLDNGNLAVVLRDGTIRDTGQKVRPQVVVRDVNGVPTVVSSSGSSTSLNPLSSLSSEAEAAGTIAGAEADARNRSAATAEQNTERTANQRTLDVWNVAKQGLVKALFGTETGPIAGRLPALTSGQQIAEGAVAAVAPVLKQLFRSAGEGVFTDRDQELLLAMVPQRTDHPETIRAKLEMIDAIIQAKLAASTPGGQSTPETAGAPQTDGGWKIEEVK